MSIAVPDNVFRVPNDLTVSPTEECRIVNLHRNLEDYLNIEPSELGKLEPSLG